eukprot:TRINITY_DN1912_c0_g1_i5.p1 TRINITY_DN1912_c0_g1~~TRINITY_DN1912_c0_g1_i5.p1  ORF type:complete len:154 (+),score=24.84 TRINITY_DN1912_c0_g1_i5:165-626(+)
MSSRRGGASKGPPKHQNKHAWKPDAGVKKKDKELGGKSHPYAAITGVCNRCKGQIEWKRKYGKYKALTEPAKCNQCGKRAVRQAYHTLCTDCAKERCVCPKCCQQSGAVGGRSEGNERLHEGEDNQREDELEDQFEADEESEVSDDNELVNTN